MKDIDTLNAISLIKHTERFRGVVIVHYNAQWRKTCIYMLFWWQYFVQKTTKQRFWDEEFHSVTLLTWTICLWFILLQIMRIWRSSTKKKMTHLKINGRLHHLEKSCLQVHTEHVQRRARLFCVSSLFVYCLFFFYFSKNVWRSWWLTDWTSVLWKV